MGTPNVLERREVRGEVLCRVRLPQGEAWVRLDAVPGEEVGLTLLHPRRFAPGTLAQPGEATRT